jgi:hypothetical protein
VLSFTETQHLLILHCTLGWHPVQTPDWRNQELTKQPRGKQGGGDGWEKRKRWARIP